VVVRVASVAFLLAVLVVGASGYRAICRGTPSAYTAIEAARARASSEAASNAGGSGAVGAARAWLAATRAAVLGTVLRLKQDDVVAFPAHVVASYAVEAGPCTPEARATQWRKAAKHAWSPPAAELAAAGLRRTLGPEAAVAALRSDASAEPWFAPRLDRVASALAGEAPN
jgi:hypothetical protein